MNTPPVILIFGMGFSGQTLARKLLADGWRVRGTSRSKGTIFEGVENFTFTAGKPIEDEKAFEGITHVLSTIPLVDEQDPVLAMHGDLLQSLNIWSGYVSATSVYTEAGGGWVTEESPTEPISRRGQLRRQAEIEWQDKLGAEIFRAAGIYGTGRSPLKKLVEGKGRIIHKPGHAFNRIHVDDMAAILMTAMKQPRPRRILNLADGAPCESGDVIRYAAELLGIAPPTPVDFEDADITPMARSFYATSRKVDASRLAQELGIELSYPDYRAGIKAILEEERKMGLLPDG